MSDLSGLAGLVEEIKQASRNLADGDARTDGRLAAIEKNVNELMKKAGRPGAEFGGYDDTDEYKSARELCIIKHSMTNPKHDGSTDDNYAPASAEVSQALTHRKALQALFRRPDPNRLSEEYRKSLSNFSFGTNEFERQAWTHREQFPTRGDKAVRAQSIRGRMSLIGLYVPAAAEWLPDLRAELLAFPTGKHDDIVDALGLVGQLMDKFAPGRLLPIEEFEWKGDTGYREIDIYGPLANSFMTL
jgi:hypothetical protein